MNVAASPAFLADVRHLLLRLIAGVMIATVAGHAIAPVAVPVERARGSAFSAATTDVSVLSDAVPAKKLAPARLLTALVILALAPIVWLVVGVRRIPTGRRRIGARAPPDPALLTVIQPLGPPAR